ncbi:hypothetical protein G6F46_006439 [Rhizopus delemar]|uniref:BHLH domain-containing protein n=2 Tax=Rhizopus TaxID=4842 RepID=A0A9P6Z2X1_9FUNG|nr:hypothetical protein G6F36_011025 [Rhizopus arrhizus]KAG1455796.1 hypothetical protein G6F55_006870 [Rhizopus delemar]KAG1497344.1 hypothetical protein G6F54_005830 [Rhizopus delemar]KAG1511160.1 hypothetical protein G6F53_006144 [Rhizopus delemar]KAG1526287.1 hypothetical protein G6F52_002564 [Rhizopus delemar]
MVEKEPLFLHFTSEGVPEKKEKVSRVYHLNGRNILNRKNVDSQTAIERIRKRRENHNHVERRRRERINQILSELATLVPNAAQHGQRLNKGNVLKLTLSHIKELQAENKQLKQKVGLSVLAPRFRLAPLN